MRQDAAEGKRGTTASHPRPLVNLTGRSPGKTAPATVAKESGVDGDATGNVAESGGQRLIRETMAELG